MHWYIRYSDITQNRHHMIQNLVQGKYPTHIHASKSVNMGKINTYVNTEENIVNFVDKIYLKYLHKCYLPCPSHFHTVQKLALEREIIIFEEFNRISTCDPVRGSRK